MKKQLILSILSLFIFSSSQLFAQEKVQWHTLEEVEELMKKEPRKIIIDVYTDWCHWCKKMDKTTFNHPEIAKYINKNFYAVKINAESKKSITFNNKTYLTKGRYNDLVIMLLKGKASFPSTVYLNENKQLITVVQSYIEPKEYDVILHFLLLEKYRTTPYEAYKKEYLGDS